MKKYYLIVLCLLFCFLFSGCFATDSSVKKMEDRIILLEKDMKELRSEKEKLEAKLAGESVEKRDTVAKLGKEVETLKKEQKILKEKLNNYERLLSNTQKTRDSSTTDVDYSDQYYHTDFSTYNDGGTIDGGDSTGNKGGGSDMGSW